ncbi:hypothetical protein ABK040_004798 [Willaertia magna]
MQPHESSSSNYNTKSHYNCPVYSVTRASEHCVSNYNNNIIRHGVDTAELEFNEMFGLEYGRAMSLEHAPIAHNYVNENYYFISNSNGYAVDSLLNSCYSSYIPQPLHMHHHVPHINDRASSFHMVDGFDSKEVMPFYGQHSANCDINYGNTSMNEYHMEANIKFNNLNHNQRALLICSLGSQATMESLLAEQLQPLFETNGETTSSNNGNMSHQNLITNFNFYSPTELTPNNETCSNKTKRKRSTKESSSTKKKKVEDLSNETVDDEENNYIDISNHLKQSSSIVAITFLKNVPVIDCLKFTPKKKVDFNLACMFELDKDHHHLYGQQTCILLDPVLLLKYGKRSISKPKTNKEVTPKENTSKDNSPYSSPSSDFSNNNSNDSNNTLTNLTLEYPLLEDNIQLLLTARLQIEGNFIEDVDKYVRLKATEKNQQDISCTLQDIKQSPLTLNNDYVKDQISGTNVNSIIQFPLSVKLLKPISGVDVDLILDLQKKSTDQPNQMESIAQWRIPIIVQGSRRKKKLEKDAELRECFGDNLWPTVDLTLAMLNRKGAQNEKEKKNISGDGFDLFVGTKYGNVVLDVYGTVNLINGRVLDQLIEEADTNLNRDTSNQYALECFNSYFQKKFNTNEPDDILQLAKSLASTVNKQGVEFVDDNCVSTTNNVDINHFNDLDLIILLKLTELYARYDPEFQLDGFKKTEELLTCCEQIILVNEEKKFQNKTKIYCLFRASEFQCQKLTFDETIRLNHAALDKCNQCYQLIQKCLKEQKKDDIHYLKAFEASLLSIKSLLLQNIHGLPASTLFCGKFDIEVTQVEEKLRALKEIVNYKYMSFQIRGRTAPKSRDFAASCNSIATCLRMFYFLFKKTSKYTPEKAVVILEVIKKIQSRAVIVQKQVNSNVTHLFYNLYRYNTKCTEMLLLKEKRESLLATDDNTEKQGEIEEKIEKTKEEERKVKFAYHSSLDQYMIVNI